jgi:hypothetical protein
MTDLVTIVTLMDPRVMKDRAAPFLSTDCVNKLDTNRLKIPFSPAVKAVNRNSSGGFPQLSHFSVDNPV